MCYGDRKLQILTHLVMLLILNITIYVYIIIIIIYIIIYFSIFSVERKDFSLKRQDHVLESESESESELDKKDSELSKAETEEALKKIVQVFDFRLIDSFGWLKLFEQNVEKFCQSETYLDSDYFYYLSALLAPEDEVWFYSEKGNNYSWKQFKKVFIDYFREKQRSSLNIVLHQEYQDGDLLEFCKNKFSELALHFPNFSNTDKIKIVVSCLRSDHYKEFCTSFDLSTERFLRVIQGYCLNNKSEEIQTPALSTAIQQTELSNYLEKALSSKSFLKLITKQIKKCNKLPSIQNVEPTDDGEYDIEEDDGSDDSKEESESDPVEVAASSKTVNANKRKTNKLPIDINKRQKTQDSLQRQNAANEAN